MVSSVSPSTASANDQTIDRLTVTRHHPPNGTINSSNVSNRRTSSNHTESRDHMTNPNMPVSTSTSTFAPPPQPASNQSSMSSPESSSPASFSLLPPVPAGFLPPMNMHQRRPPKTAVVLTANVNNKSASSSSSVLLASPRLTHSTSKKNPGQDSNIIGIGDRISISGGPINTTNSLAVNDNVSTNHFERACNLVFVFALHVL